MPYLAMLDRLRAFLKQPAGVLIIAGFSFGDDHLNEIIVQGLQGEIGDRREVFPKVKKRGEESYLIPAPFSMRKTALSN
jgi:hypothetical protein